MTITQWQGGFRQNQVACIGDLLELLLKFLASDR